MNHRAKSQAGIGHIAAIASFIAVFAIIAFIGYRLYANPTENPTGSNSLPPTSAVDEVDANDAPTISSTADLDKATNALNQVDTDNQSADDSTQLDRQLNDLQ